MQAGSGNSCNKSSENGKGGKLQACNWLLMGVLECYWKGCAWFERVAPNEWLQQTV
jgi:hypothetical protein